MGNTERERERERGGGGREEERGREGERETDSPIHSLVVAPSELLMYLNSV